MSCDTCKNFEGMTKDGMSICKAFELSEHGSLEERVYIRPHNGCNQKKEQDRTPKVIEEFDPDMRRVRFCINGKRRKKE